MLTRRPRCTVAPHNAVSEPHQITSWFVIRIQKKLKPIESCRHFSWDWLSNCPGWCTEDPLWAGRPHFTVSGSLQGGFIRSVSRKSDYQNKRLQWLLLWWQLVVLSDWEFPPEKNWEKISLSEIKGPRSQTKRSVRKQNCANSLPMYVWKISNSLKFQLHKLCLWNSRDHNKNG